MADYRDAAALLTDLEKLGGAGLICVPFEENPDSAHLEALGAGVVRVGVHRLGSLPTDGLERFDILLTTEVDAPRPWIGLPRQQLDATLIDLATNVTRQPVAAAMAAQVFRVSLDLTFEQALVSESLAYSALLASSGFRDWRASTPRRQRDQSDAPRVLIERSDATLHIQLNRPEVRNAFDAGMRDALVDACEVATRDPGITSIVLSAIGPCFSSGGDLDEFGSAQDPGVAHLIRTLRSPARMIFDMRGRVTAYVKGACVGAGIEVPAAAGLVVAKPDAKFRLPEVSMGLIPGAGGTVSIPRRIGRHRACYMAISGYDIDVITASRWGLIDAIDPE